MFVSEVIEDEATHQTSCFCPATRAAGLKGSSRRVVADMVRSGVRVVVSRVVRVELRMACKAGVIMLPRMTSWEKNSFVQLVDVTF